MDDKKWTLTLADGTKAEGLTLNGTNYGSEAELDESIFTDNCEPCTFTASDGETRTYEHGIYDSHFYAKEDNRHYYFIREKTANEILNESIQSQIDYLAMMTDTDMEG